MLSEGIQIQAIRDLVQDDFALVNQLIHKRLYSDISLVQQISQHIITSGGKRLRPLLVLLSARALNYSGVEHAELATIIEFIHTATLLHDDVVDESSLRRGRNTANTIWGNKPSILVGDFLYSRAFQMMANLKNMRVIEILADATNLMVEGEVLQLMNRNNPNTTEQHYMEVIRLKTAKLFEVACQLGAIITKVSLEQEYALANYGLHLGLAYQLIDDILDFSADKNALGKNLGDDLAEGKPTLPLIYAMRNGNSKQAEIIRTAIMQGGLEQLDVILETIHATHALEYAKNLAAKQIDLAIQALNVIANSTFRTALIDLAHFAIQRHN